jgi:hypothetical protein
MRCEPERCGEADRGRSRRDYSTDEPRREFRHRPAGGEVRPAA